MHLRNHPVISEFSMNGLRDPKYGSRTTPIANTFTYYSSRIQDQLVVVDNLPFGIFRFDAVAHLFNLIIHPHKTSLDIVNWNPKCYKLFHIIYDKVYKVMYDIVRIATTKSKLWTTRQKIITMNALDSCNRAIQYIRPIMESESEFSSLEGDKIALGYRYHYNVHGQRIGIHHCKTGRKKCCECARLFCDNHNLFMNHGTLNDGQLMFTEYYNDNLQFPLVNQFDLWFGANPKYDACTTTSMYEHLFSDENRASIRQLICDYYIDGGTMMANDHGLVDDGLDCSEIMYHANVVSETHTTRSGATFNAMVG